MPCQRVLGEAMHEENGRSFAVVAEVDRDVFKLDTFVFPVVEIRQLRECKPCYSEHKSADDSELHTGR